jgi:RNA polymerase sigma factor (sigma-70 family)
METLKHCVRKHCEASAAGRREQPLTENMPDPSPQFDAAEGDAAFLSALSARERRIVSLKEQGYKHKEIAGMLGVRPGTVDSAVSRAKAKIVAFLEEGGK